MFRETIELAAPVVLALDDTAATLERVGGKGASLARMAGLWTCRSAQRK